MIAIADGSIVIDVDLNTGEAEQELAGLKKKILHTEERLTLEKTKKNTLADSLKEARRELHELQKPVIMSGGKAIVSPEDVARMAELKKQIQNMEGDLEKTKKRISEAGMLLEGQKARYGEIAKSAGLADKASSRMAKAVQKAEKNAQRFGMRLKEVVRSALVFTVITRALAAFRSWMGKVVKTNDEAQQALARLRGALLTMVQPLVEVIVPAFTALVNVLTRVVSVIAQILAMLFGRTADGAKDSAKALHQETQALEGTGNAAKKAEKQLASFDEINQLSDTSGTSGGSGGELAPNFDFGAELSDGQLHNILSLIELIGAALLAWKLSDSFAGGLKMALGLFMAINGAVGLIQETTDAWTNGVSWENLLGMLGRGAELAAGLWLAFGKVGGAIGMIVTGLALLATGFHDADINGWNLQNTLTTIAGILATGCGIAILAGSWIPVLIAGIAALLVSLTIATGHGEELIAGVKMVLQGFRDFFVGVFTGDIGKAVEGIGLIVDGLKGIVLSVVAGVRDSILSFLDWLDEKTGGKLSPVISMIKGLITGVFDTVSTTLGNVFNSIKTILTGIAEFVSGVFTGDWDRAWQGVKDIFKGMWNHMISLLEGAVNLIIRGINWMIKQLNKISFDVPDWVPGVGGKSIGFSIPAIGELQIPRLAQGAVIPPNREFLAVLGDQRRGTNIEAPLETIEQAVANVIGRMGLVGGSEVSAVLEIDRQQFGRLVYRYGKDEARRVGVRLTEV